MKATTIALALALALASAPVYAQQHKPEHVNLTLTVPTAPVVWPLCTAFEGALDLMRIDAGEYGDQVEAHSEAGEAPATAADQFCMQDLPSDSNVHVTALYRADAQWGLIPARVTGSIDGKTVTGWIVLNIKEDLPPEKVPAAR